MTVELKGFDDLLKKLDALKNQEIKKATSRAVRKGLKKTREKAKTNARQFDDPKTSESIEKNIAIKVSSKKHRSQGITKGSVGVRGGAKKGKSGKFGETFYWRFLELGTSKMPAKPFMRPAFDPQEVTDTFKKAMAKAIHQEINKR